MIGLKISWEKRFLTNMHVCVRGNEIGMCVCVCVCVCAVTCLDI